MDKRHKKRIEIIQDLYAYTFMNSGATLPFNTDTTKNIIQNLEQIDGYIHSFAVKFPIEKIAKTDLAILRLAVYELKISATEPEKVIINEAVELAKEFGGEKSYSFVNGVLGKIIK